MKIILTDQAPVPAGHYSQAIVHGGLVYVAGQLPIATHGSGPGPGGRIEAQVEQALRNLEAILTAAGSSLDRVLKVTVYIDNVARWPLVNAAYAAYFGAHRPARTVVPTGPLHHGYAVELDAVAAVGYDMNSPATQRR